MSNKKIFNIFIFCLFFNLYSEINDLDKKSIKPADKKSVKSKNKKSVKSVNKHIKFIDKKYGLNAGAALNNLNDKIIKLQKKYNFEIIFNERSYNENIDEYPEYLAYNE
mgnify:CR=1 FL=1